MVQGSTPLRGVADGDYTNTDFAVLPRAANRMPEVVYGAMTSHDIEVRRKWRAVALERLSAVVGLRFLSLRAALRGGGCLTAASSG
jgi:hypothetical protein